MQILQYHSTKSANLYDQLPYGDVSIIEEELQNRLFPSFCTSQQVDAANIEQQDDHLLCAIEEWLLQKYGLTQSKCTVTTYREIVLSLRAYLCTQGLDLDSTTAEVAASIQHWANLRGAGSKRQGSVAPSTYNQRIAAVASFYRWAIDTGFYTESNPTDQLARASVQKYSQAYALNPQQVSSKLKSIDRSTPRGLRDYMLLQVALNTGRSAQELAALTWGNVSIENGLITLTFERCKGGKTLYNTLDSQLSCALLAYLRTMYGEQLHMLASYAPLWMSFSDRTYGQAIGMQTIADICESHLGVSTIHTLRHTFALTMNQLGAETSTIQEQLGHENRATTSNCLNKLKKASSNPYAPALAHAFGVEV